MLGRVKIREVTNLGHTADHTPRIPFEMVTHAYVPRLCATHGH
ncbi:hypothetical protein F383_35854 [Gossypium arboreum]|uniref:Uncharacterized protein n=1 Tax=Gossypium arboreum TaxID=29729 RepID=A0A0B0N2B8_GOSAR|nr:hypothetical protein F383_35854 [Gossypium arboreum]